MKKGLIVALCALLTACGESGGKPAAPQLDYVANAQRWIDEEFQPSTLSQAEQTAEMTWFTQAAEPYRGLTINVVSETLTTHEYESETLTKAFYEITGIQVNHDLIQEG
ncbi:MAG: carbohydrate ABC transporter substrate-binding protein, partial [Pseudomonadota bacterium]|nr:carbohydrate ABC transporter substrate-binding protein [Pseudomonadota bacterium]